MERFFAEDLGESRPDEEVLQYVTTFLVENEDEVEMEELQ